MDIQGPRPVTPRPPLQMKEPVKTPDLPAEAPDLPAEAPEPAPQASSTARDGSQVTARASNAKVSTGDEFGDLSANPQAKGEATTGEGVSPGMAASPERKNPAASAEVPSGTSGNTGGAGSPPPAAQGR